MQARSDRFGGDLVHPLALIALCGLAANDHVLKAAFPSPATGKLSDFAGLVVAPLVLATCARWLLPATSLVRIRVGSAAVVVLGFVVVKLSSGGALAFGWSLGVTQWLLGGWLAGGQPQPAAIVADPTDLVALPAVGLVLWIWRRRPAATGGTGQRPTRRRDVMALVTATLVLLATSQSAPSVTGSWSDAVHLTDEVPVVARHVTVSVDQGKGRERLTFLDVSSTGSSNDAGLEMTILVDDRAGEPPASAYDPLEAWIDLSERCRAGCETGATIILRRREGATGDIAATLATTIRVSGDAEAAGLAEVKVAIDDDPARGFSGNPERLTVSASGLVRATIDDRDAAATTHLRIDCAALGPIGYPVIGRLRVDANVESAGEHAWTSSWQVTVADDTRRPGSEDPPIDLDIARFCGANRRGEVPIEFFVSYQPITAGVSPQPSSVSGFVEYRWTADLEILAFDGRDLPDSFAQFTDP
jgi:hypothetical protein